VKVIPSNQTLLLANEREKSGGRPTTALVRALGNAADEAVLKRVTIVASRPDDTLVYLQADYGNAAPVARIPARISPQAPQGSPHNSSRGVELYASTQRMLGETPLTQIDVFA